MAKRAPVIAYLIDADGRVHQRHVIYEKNAQAAVEQMNKTAAAYTDWRLLWTLKKPEGIKDAG